jgi:hypothetical protein
MQLFWKNPSQMSYIVQGSMAFWINKLGHDINHGIVCQN